MTTEFSKPIERVVAYCTAQSYDLKAIGDALKDRYNPGFYRDLVHFEVGKDKDLFFFSYGAVVMWGLSKNEEQEILTSIESCQKNPQLIYERELMSYTFSTVNKIVGEVIVLANEEMLSRLALSHGLAQSVRLATFENSIQNTIDKTKLIPEQIAKDGKIQLSKKEIRKKMGQLFLERSSINLHFDILDTPEFFWEHSDLEPVYKMIAKHLDLDTRVQVLNMRLDIVHELFEMMVSELNHQHSSRLEWIIIWLIVIEVLLSLMRDIVEFF